MLKIDKLKKQYKNFHLNCSMEVKEGMITGFVGPNGSGKSTTLKAVLGLIYIDGGDIQIFGKNVKDIKPEDKEQIGVFLPKFLLKIDLQNLLEVLLSTLFFSPSLVVFAVLLLIVLPFVSILR